MSDPSWRSSTLSQAFFVSLIFYMGLIVITAIGLLFFNADLEKAKLVIGWGSALEAAISSAYLTARKVNGNGTAPTSSASSTPTATP